MILPVIFTGLAINRPRTLIIGLLDPGRHGQRLCPGLQAQKNNSEEDE